MKIEVIGPVGRGAPVGARSCDICRARGRPLQECNIRYLDRSNKQANGFWYDLCAECLSRLQRMPDLPPDQEKAHRAFDRAKQRLRETVR